MLPSLPSCEPSGSGSTILSASFDDEDWDDCSLEGMKRASAALDLHPSSSCSLLLPCGLLPEELAELEGSCLAASLKEPHETNADVEAAFKSISLSAADEDEPAAPLTPLAFKSRKAVPAAEPAEPAEPAVPAAKRALVTAAGGGASVLGARADVAGVEGVEASTASEPACISA